MTGGLKTIKSFLHVKDACRIYVISSDHWLEGPSLNQARSMHSSCALQNKVYVYGGNHIDHGYIGSIESIDATNLL